MKGVILAAGKCRRLRPLTKNLPKCMLPVNGKTIFDRALDALKRNDITGISVITGYCRYRIPRYKGIKYYFDKGFRSHDILHSLVWARKEALDGSGAIIMYSDILFKDALLRSLKKDRHAICLVVDTNWKKNYQRRRLHPRAEAEKVVFDRKHFAVSAGKNISGMHDKQLGEFIGMLKLSRKGARTFFKHFDEINKALRTGSRFQRSSRWEKAYLTDFLQELMDRGEKIHCTLTKNRWFEVDTVEDYHNALKRYQHEN